MNQIAFYLSHWQSWHPAWRSQSEQAVPLSLRRRMTSLGRDSLALAWDMVQKNSNTPYYLFASRHGDFERTYNMLNMLAAENELSPADFSLSVHHALCGLLSIVTHNTNGHLALAAGCDTFGCALLEAALLLQEQPQREILLVYYDSPLPPAYDSVGRTEEPVIAAAFLLSATQTDRRAIALQWMPRQQCTEAHATHSLAESFIHFLENKEENLWIIGERLCWNWRYQT
ncbi:beta-ketoacyl synthase chain length factor [Candidatus Magnetaquicoccus inordinatus]|uniref:beta-ketoacyl synthase chain length factor n=1 Tax=Candidatus Magnetaquicoccus inordinatus TaxID=2496818 RepID=UPI00102B3D50|nr:beta-ketoacyl synthase chain length factor [Candidatus Magnetaquicoccus inordinatus]